MANEPIVKRGRVPRGYSLVLKGNVYITANCRKQTQNANRTVYLVVNAKDKQIGIAVPSEIHEDVKQREIETRTTRAANVDRRDNAIRKDFEKIILQEFPRLPREDLPKILQKALEKRAGKVGRTGQLSESKKAHLAVRAHIRHCDTPYEALLKGTRGKKGKKAKFQAREMVQGQVDELASYWAQTRSGQPKGQRFRPAQAARMVSSPASPPPPSRPGGMVDPERAPKPIGSRPGRVRQSAEPRTMASATGLPDWPDATLPLPQRSVKAREQVPRGVIDLTIDDDDEDEDEEDWEQDEEYEEDDEDDEDEDEDEDSYDEDWEQDEECEEDDDDDDLPDLMVTTFVRIHTGGHETKDL